MSIRLDRLKKDANRIDFSLTKIENGKYMLKSNDDNYNNDITEFYSTLNDVNYFIRNKGFKIWFNKNNGIV